MIDERMIPAAVVEAALRAFTGSACDCNSCRKAVIRTILAALNAWPGISHCERPEFPAVKLPSIILPLPQEKRDEN